MSASTTPSAARARPSSAGTCVAETTCTRLGDVLVVLNVSPLYLAVMAWLPGVSALVENVATPALTVPLPISAAPSKNCTVPAGEPGPVTVAVNCTLAPGVEGLRELATAVVVGFSTI